MERTYWLWAGSSWVVAVKFADGTCACACDPSLTVRIDRADDLALVVVGQRPLAVTVPAPPWPTSWPNGFDASEGEFSSFPADGAELQMDAAGATSGVIAISPLGRLPNVRHTALPGDDPSLNDLSLPEVGPSTDDEPYRRVSGGE